MALIINELVQNALNHAFQNTTKGVILITLKKAADYVEVTVLDNGIGFEYQPNITGNLGLEICHTLVQEDLNGEIVFKNTGKGTMVTIGFHMPEVDQDEL
ncbi:ATP-binding protein [Bacillus sp. JJ1764]|uniref:ATP-binding protein n=1 Tax=Bacillus sp. JJ1764 TaxID=3122964 RepID=UPI0030001E95